MRAVGRYVPSRDIVHTAVVLVIDLDTGIVMLEVDDLDTITI
jgi:hypothetical protein